MTLEDILSEVEIVESKKKEGNFQPMFKLDVSEHQVLWEFTVTQIL